MQKKSRITFGPGAASVILIVVILSMSVLALLTLVNARNDRRLSDRSAQVIESVYALDEKAERMFADLDSIVADAAKKAKDQDAHKILDSAVLELPEEVTIEGDTISWTMSDDLRDLECAARVDAEDGEAKLTWIRHRMVMRTEDTWNLGIF